MDLCGGYRCYRRAVTTEVEGLFLTGLGCVCSLQFHVNVASFSGGFPQRDAQISLLSFWTKKNTEKRQIRQLPAVSAGCLQIQTLLTASNLFLLEPTAVPDWVLQWGECAGERDEVLGGTWRGALQEAPLEDGDIRHFLR